MRFLVNSIPQSEEPIFDVLRIQDPFGPGFLILVETFRFKHIKKKYFQSLHYTKDAHSYVHSTFVRTNITGFDCFTRETGFSM